MERELGDCRIGAGQRLTIESGGALVLAEDSEFRVDREYWDDYTVSAVRGRQGNLQKPDFDYTNIGLLFPQDDPDEILYVSDQMPHKWTGGVVRPHIHWIQTSATVAGWKMDYRWFNNGDTEPEFTTGAEIESSAFAYTSGSIVQISKFPEIDLSGLNASALFDIKIYRDDNDIEGDVRLKSFDFHYRIGGKTPFGSRQEYTR